MILYEIVQKQAAASHAEHHPKILGEREYFTYNKVDSFGYGGEEHKYIKKLETTVCWCWYVAIWK